MVCRYMDTLACQRVPNVFTSELSRSGPEAVPSQSFLQALQEWSPQGLPGADGADRFNVLVVGLAGSGKSSTINSMLKLVEPPGMRSLFDCNTHFQCFSQYAAIITSFHFTVPVRKLLSACADNLTVLRPLQRVRSYRPASDLQEPST